MTAPFEFFRVDGTLLGGARSLDVAPASLFAADLERAVVDAFMQWTPADLAVRDNTAGRWLLAREARVTVRVPPAVAPPRFRFAATVDVLSGPPWEAGARVTGHAEAPPPARLFAVVRSQLPDGTTLEIEPDAILGRVFLLDPRSPKSKHRGRSCRVESIVVDESDSPTGARVRFLDTGRPGVVRDLFDLAGAARVAG